jgi:protein-serine/threonine kinase
MFTDFVIANFVECASYGQISMKSDVYSYGVVLMELVTGRRPTDFEVDDTEDTATGAYSLIKLVHSRMESHDIRTIVDQELSCEYDLKEESINSLLTIALNCTKENPGDRPTMEEIILRLNAIGQNKAEDTHFLSETNSGDK